MVNGVPAPTCPKCKAPLAPGRKGELDFWSCPNGHGLGFTMSEAYGRVEEDEISELWHASESAPAGKTPCPYCGLAMASVAVRVEGARLTLDVCRDDQFFWFDPGELDLLPPDLADPEPTPEEQRKIDAVLAAFDHDLEAGIEAEGNRGLLNRLAGTIARDHPGFARLLEHTVYGDALDRLEAETDREQRDLAEQWHAGRSGPAA